MLHPQQLRNSLLGDRWASFAGDASGLNTQTKNPFDLLDVNKRTWEAQRARPRVPRLVVLRVHRLAAGASLPTQDFVALVVAHENARVLAPVQLGHGGAVPAALVHALRPPAHNAPCSGSRAPTSTFAMSLRLYVRILVHMSQRQECLVAAPKALSMHMHILSWMIRTNTELNIEAAIKSWNHCIASDLGGVSSHLVLFLSAAHAVDVHARVVGSSRQEPVVRGVLRSISQNYKGIKP